MPRFMAHGPPARRVAQRQRGVARARSREAPVDTEKLAFLHPFPKLVIDDALFRHLRGYPFVGRVRAVPTLVGVGVPQAVSPVETQYAPRLLLRMLVPFLGLP